MTNINMRLNLILSRLFAGNVSEFARKSGIPQPTLNNIVANRLNKPSSDNLERLLNSMPDINAEWLITGEGEMLKDNTVKSSMEEIVYVPLLPISAQGGSLDDFVVSVKGSECEKIISPIKGADWAITVSGDSMAPEYPSGSQILIKKINENAFIDWGKVYVLDTCNGIVIKILVPSEREGYIKCLSINKDERYASFEISFNDIHGIYRVMLCMSMK
ncbi:MAG: helix-turn-helix transcriptional regulator [Dysgonamonadaceae bacterium]|jgi:phage repressor protein C with HTH and peptisase S24 domain|nr:helix-turn-helix transcriptional regulator [Dysgonamonadaceae bacterium]